VAIYTKAFSGVQLRYANALQAVALAPPTVCTPVWYAMDYLRSSL